MMADIGTWESRFVDAYIMRSKRERYLSFLRAPRRRKEILNRLNHTFDYDPNRATRLEPPLIFAEPLIALLRERGADETSVYMLALSGDDAATPLSSRECHELLWTDESWSSDPHQRRVFVHLTDEGWNRWTRGDWVDPWGKCQ